MERDNTKRLIKNTLLLYFRMFLLMAVSLYTSRVVLMTLGVVDYGIYNIVGGVIVLFSFFKSAMSNATLRFLSYEIGRNDQEKLKKTFSMSLNVHLVISVIVLIFAESIGLWFLNTQLNIPEGRMYAARWVYQFSIATFIINIIRVPYQSIIISYEKMSFYALLSILEGFLKLAIVFLLLRSSFDKLILYGLLLFIVSIIILFAFILFCIKKFKASHYTFFRDRALFKDLLSFSSWSLLGSIANVGSKQGTSILLNIYYGVTLNAAMGIANQVANAINGFVQNFQTAFRPQIVKAYVKGNKNSFINLLLGTSKLSYYLLFTISLPVLINTKPILQMWLMDVPPYAVEFCQLIIIYSLLESISGPLWMTVQATGKIKIYQIVISMIIISNLWLTYLCFEKGQSPSSMLYVKIGISILCLLFRIVYLCRTIKFLTSNFFLKILIHIISVTAVSVFFSVILRYKFMFFKNIIISILTTITITLATIYVIGIGKEEKLFIKSFLKFKKGTP